MAGFVSNADSRNKALAAASASTTIIDNGALISTFPVHFTGQNETHLSAIEAHA